MDPRIASYQRELSPRCYEVLAWMAEHHDKPADEIDDGELVYERGRAYIGNTRVATRTFRKLLRAMAISLSSDSEIGAFERYRINSTGRELLASRVAA